MNLVLGPKTTPLARHFTKHGLEPYTATQGLSRNLGQVSGEDSVYVGWDRNYEYSTSVQLTRYGIELFSKKGHETVGIPGGYFGVATSERTFWEIWAWLAYELEMVEV